MLLVERHIIKKSSPLYTELDSMSLLSKNLYNTALYEIRQHYFTTKQYLNYVKLAHKLASSRQIDYKSLPAKISQQVLKQVDNNFVSFFKSIKSPNIKHHVSLPKYLNKTGRNLLVFTNQAISRKQLKYNIIKLSGCKNTIKCIHNNVRQVRVVPAGNHFVVEIIYSRTEKQKGTNNNFAGIDLGLNNLATVGGNNVHSIIINGKPLKSINQFYNKKLSKLKSRQGKSKSINSKKIKTLTNKRNNKIKDYLHKASRLLVNYLVSNDVSTVVIGHNKGWKQDINIGKANNQNFVQIPFNSFIQMIEYKAKLEGVNVVVREESYTSKCSFIDNETIEKHEHYKGVRIKRGLFKSSTGRLLNADLNGSLNILRKEVPNAFDGYGIEVCNTPTVLTVKQ